MFGNRLHMTKKVILDRNPFCALYTWPPHSVPGMWPSVYGSPVCVHLKFLVHFLFLL